MKCSLRHILTQRVSHTVTQFLSHITQFHMNAMEGLISVHETERRLLRRMIEMGMEKELAEKIMAFWIWLKSHENFKDIVQKINSHDDKILAMVCLEAESALSSTEAGVEYPTTSKIRLPMTLSVAADDRSLSLDDIFTERERASEGINQLRQGLCKMIFEDVSGEGGREKIRTRRHPMAEIVQNSGGAFALGSSSSSRLNPLAKEWKPAAEDDRSLYITFSNGFPISQNQIYLFFTKKYGACLERIYVNQPMDGPPQFGRLVFKASLFPALVMNGRDQIKLRIFGRSMWCKKFRAKKISHGRNSSSHQ